MNEEPGMELGLAIQINQYFLSRRLGRGQFAIERPITSIDFLPVTEHQPKTLVLAFRDKPPTKAEIDHLVGGRFNIYEAEGASYIVGEDGVVAMVHSEDYEEIRDGYSMRHPILTLDKGGTHIESSLISSELEGMVNVPSHPPAVAWASSETWSQRVMFGYEPDRGISLPKDMNDFPGLGYIGCKPCIAGHTWIFSQSHISYVSLFAVLRDWMLTHMEGEFCAYYPTPRRGANAFRDVTAELVHGRILN